MNNCENINVISGGSIGSSSSNQHLMLQIQKIHLKLEDLRLRLNEPIVPLTNEAILHLSTELQPLYRALIMYNLDEFVARNLDSALWSDCFKTPLTRYGRTDKNLFNLMIESGVGFYLGLIQDIGVHFDISFITNAPSVTKLYCTSPVIDTHFIKPSKNSIYFIIQNCLLHVGDLLRYRGTSYSEAIKMYEKSAAVCPTYGAPYHSMGLTQLLITTTSGDEANRMEGFLTCLYYFARSLSVSNRYLPALQSIENLIKTKVEPMDLKTLSLSQEMLRIFMVSIYENLCAPTLFQLMSQVVQSQLVNASTLVKMIVIALWNNWRSQFSPNSLDIIACLFNSVVAAMLSAIEDNPQQSTYCLPHLKILIEWMNWHQDNPAMPYFFGKVNSLSLVSVLNYLQSKDQFQQNPPNNSWALEPVLPEEKKLVGFIPMDYALCFNASSAGVNNTAVSNSTGVSSSILNANQARLAPAMGGHLLSEDKDFALSLNLRIHRVLCVALKLASSKKCFLHDGTKFLEAPTSPFNVNSLASYQVQPSRRNVALQTIFRSSHTNANTSVSAETSPLGDNSQQPQLQQLVTPGICPSSTSSLLSSSSFGGMESLTAPSLTPTMSLPTTSNNLTTTHDFFRSIWTPDADSTDSKWN